MKTIKKILANMLTLAFLINSVHATDNTQEENLVLEEQNQVALMPIAPASTTDETMTDETMTEQAAVEETIVEPAVSDDTTQEDINSNDNE